MLTTEYLTVGCSSSSIKTATLFHWSYQSYQSYFKSIISLIHFLQAATRLWSFNFWNLRTWVAMTTPSSLKTVISVIRHNPHPAVIIETHWILCRFSFLVFGFLSWMTEYDLISLPVWSMYTIFSSCSITYLSWSRGSCGTWWACSLERSRPEPWQLHGGCYRSYEWSTGAGWRQSWKTSLSCSLWWRWTCLAHSSPSLSAASLWASRSPRAPRWPRVCVWWLATLLQRLSCRCLRQQRWCEVVRQ